MDRMQLATTGLFAAWLAHDLEELATMSASSRNLTRRLPASLPVPAPIRERGLSQPHVNRAVAVVGIAVAAAAAHGQRTRGRSALYQNVLLGFGLHGFGHIAVTVLVRGYTSGVATSPTIVIPFWVWATRTINQAGVPNRRRVPAAIAVAVASVAVGHLVAALLPSSHPDAAAATLE